MTKKKKELTREEELVEEGLADPKPKALTLEEKTLGELEKEMDYATLQMLEACSKVQSLHEEFEKAKHFYQNSLGVFNEAKCRYLAAKLGIERDQNRDVRKAVWIDDIMQHMQSERIIK